ncbi:MAG: protein kinase, partial [Candidatus Eisenbacteria bacterium]|nr:protein kinase [Candidatus Eisenbacteria bacterium]
MGIVYRAQDEVLERPVALKLLPPDVVHSPGRLAQLTREAQLLASLNHPNIAIIHGMEDSAEGLRYLVLEWVPGETLAARLRRGPLSIAEGFEVCLQVAHALAAAHAAGVIHRDLKPGNIMIAADGRVKVVDFGLAQRFVPSEDRPSSQAPTTITGTLGYLAPECLHGQGDHRVDVFAFGCVLYECLTGKAAFPGASAEQILEAIAQAEPDASALPSQCSPALKRILDDCLRKDPKERAASFLQIAQDLEAARHKRPLDRRTFRVGFPSPGTRFVGRLQETKQCRALLEPGGMVTLTGPGGVGKTRLAISVAESLEPELEGLGFVDLASVQNPDGVPEALAAALEIKDEPPLPLLERIRKHLADSRTLIVLDNCEHVAGAVSDLVTTLRSSCPELSILATSRMSLHLPGERTYVVEPLPIPMDDGTEDPRTLARCEAVQLFVERAAGTDASFVPDAQALLSIARICRRVEGLPLAIELAAARVPVLSLDEIATRLDRQLQLLRDNTGRMAPRHRALHAAIAWSVRQLRPSEARLFRALSVFQDGWDLAAATAIGSVTDEFETLDLLASLIDKSLVFATVTRAGTSRYRFLEPVRQFARSQLAADPED